MCSSLQVVPERELTLKELAQHDGSDPDRPLLLAIRGTVFDITPGTLYDGMWSLIMWMQ